MMADREKVIKQLENDVIATDTGYVEVPLWLFSEILTLLKEQEAVEPVTSESYRTQSGRMSRRRAWCGACGLGIRVGSNTYDRSNYCERCGRKVKWDG